MRLAGIADITALHALVESAYRGAAARAGWTHEADLIDGQRIDIAMLTAMITDRAQSIGVIEEAAMLIGCVAIEARDDHGYISLLTVAPTMQARGTGRMLLSQAEAHIRGPLGRHRACMSVIGERKTLIAWYGRLGYVDTGRRLPFPYGDRRFGDPRRDDLIFHVLEKSLA